MVPERFFLTRICLVAVLAMTAAVAAATLSPESQNRAVLAILSQVEVDGLDPGSYRVPALSEPSARNAALKAALLDYMRDVRDGRPALKSLDPDMALPPPVFDAESALEAAAKRGNLPEMLAHLPPSALDYARLKEALARYRAIAAAGGWSMISAASNSAQLRTRLAFEDDLKNLSDSEALKRFQVRHGLVSDGVVGTATLTALNVPAAARAETIAANMERWRWLPRELEAERIVINAADARLELFAAGKIVLTSRVIVGRPDARTPILRAEGAGITLNPP